MTAPTYYPPASHEMHEAQNDERSLQLLVAQRLLYSKAKVYLNIRLVGMFVIAIAAPVVGSVWPSLTVACGAVAGLWIFLGRTYLTAKQSKAVDRAAAVQEQVDVLIFGMPTVHTREHSPSLEDIAKLTGSGSEVQRLARVEKVRGWYPLESTAQPLAAVAISQRANVSYSDSLLRTTAKVWRLAIGSWAALAIALAFILHVDFANMLLVIVLPLLPAFLDLVDFTRNYESASHIRSTTAREIELAIEGRTDQLSPGQLLIWQERMYELRRTTPLVPDLIYWLQRKRNERAMTDVANRLGGSSDE